MNIEILKGKIRDVPDFPKPGIIFKDITPLLSDVESLRGVVDIFAEKFSDEAIDTVVAIESRGFIFGGPLACRLGAGFVPVRKPGKLPYKTYGVEYTLEYGTGRVEMHIDALNSGSRVLIVDDLLATGGTAKAACDLAKRFGANVVACAFVIELGFLNGREKLKGEEIFSLIKY